VNIFLDLGDSVAGFFVDPGLKAGRRLLQE
jgi:hypothetical protein